jgi:hypothetical protein
VAESAVRGAPGGITGGVRLDWDSADFEFGAEYLAIGRTFDGQLGYFPQTNVRETKANAGYTPVLRNDWVREVDVRAFLNQARTLDDALVFTRTDLQLQTLLLNDAVLALDILPATEGVLQPFSFAGGRFTVGRGNYSVLQKRVSIKSPPRRIVDLELGYLEGDLFGGYEHVPSVSVGFHYGRFNTATLYRLYDIALPTGNTTIVGHQLSSSSAFAYTPLANSTLIVEANTLDTRATVQLVNSWSFGLLSTVSLIAAQTAATADLFFRKPQQSVLLSFACGLSPL